MSDSDIAAATVLNGETMLMDWGESSTQGPWIKLRLQTTEELDAFRGMTKAKGGKNGQRLATCCVEIGDDEQPVPRATTKGGPLSQLAAQWCRDADFQAWLFQEYPKHVDHLWPNVVDPIAEPSVARLLRVVCTVNSRAELDNDPFAKQAFEERIREPYMAYLKENT